VALRAARLASASYGGKTYWFAAEQPKRVPAGDVVHLLPNYDELVIAYKDHGPSFDPRTTVGLVSLAKFVFRHLVARNVVVTIADRACRKSSSRRRGRLWVGPQRRS
jgi:hypothetical protein